MECVCADSSRGHETWFLEKGSKVSITCREPCASWTVTYGHLLGKSISEFTCPSLSCKYLLNAYCLLCTVCARLRGPTMNKTSKTPDFKEPLMGHKK